MLQEHQISSFSGLYHFLSNFSAAEVWLDGMSYPSTEHAYQAAKSFDIRDRRDIQMCSTPNDAKRRGRKTKHFRKDWEDIKYKTMHQLVRQKFRQHPDLSDRLLATGDAELVEGNWWGDTTWGVCNGKGSNWLGKILMDVRKELKERIDGAQNNQSQNSPGIPTRSKNA